MNKNYIILIIFGVTLLGYACNNSPIDKQNTFKAMQENLSKKNLKEEITTFNVNGKEHSAYYVYSANDTGKRPGILVFPEWWGLNDYARDRAKMLATLGYAAMAVDVYGHNASASTPEEATALLQPFAQHPDLSKTVADAALQKLTSFGQVDPQNLGMIGYCFGGYVAINAGILGTDVKGVVTFHPSLGGAKPVDSVKAKFLICHGADDEFENKNVDSFKKTLNDAHIDFDFKTYADSKHAFTSPKATEIGQKFNIPTAYNEKADAQSWKDMKEFFKNIFD